MSKLKNLAIAIAACSINSVTAKITGTNFINIGMNTEPIVLANLVNEFFNIFKAFAGVITLFANVF